LEIEKNPSYIETPIDDDSAKLFIKPQLMHSNPPKKLVVKMDPSLEVLFLNSQFSQLTNPFIEDLKIPPDAKEAKLSKVELMILS